MPYDAVNRLDSVTTRAPASRKPVAGASSGVQFNNPLSTFLDRYSTYSVAPTNLEAMNKPFGNSNGSKPESEYLWRRKSTGCFEM